MHEKVEEEKQKVHATATLSDYPLEFDEKKY